MANFWQDLRFAFRALGKSPWFAAIAIVTLSLGIAVNTCIFSMVNGFLLRPMPVPHPEQIPVLAYSYWQKRFAGDSNVIGKSVEMNGHSLTIVGVAPQGFHGTYFIVDSDLYLPLSVNVGTKDEKQVQNTWTQRSERSLTLMAR